MSKLNKDILFLIFEELQDDSKSLFSCLIVNKLWCETVIPILWRNPWRYNIDYSKKNYLFAIISSYLTDDIKESLMKQLPSVSCQSLLFDYLSFCRSINVNIMKSMISIGSSSEYNQFLLQQEFYNLFMRKCLRFRYLDLRSVKHTIFHLPESRLCFESLCELKCDTSINSSYFYELANICQYIQKLEIVNLSSESNYGIAKLIEVQKNLKYFEWTEDHFRVNPCKEIFLELEKKADHLNHLKLFFQYFNHFDYTIIQRLLPKLHKIKSLIINEFSFINENLLKRLAYNDLEILNIDYITINEASIIIDNSGGHLKRVSLKPCDFLKCGGDFDEDSLIFIRKIYENCPSIEYLSLAFSPSNDHFVEFEKLLKVCQNLKSLLLISPNIYRHGTEEIISKNGEELLKVLIRSAPNNLRELRFFNDFKFSLDVLENFLEKWRGRPALSILTSNLIYENYNYKNLINKYKNNGVIKTFRYEPSIMNIENMNFII
ncbi:hypothetical protein RhiirA1_454960 [Rhizophagus irregularis]|uniref:F-box domain-containing protein n=1 Tax=Rhizophagus irregularis TaxID=588596 RepID=A0A2N0S3Z7_9GLOM|nr:hypothetical protein RhiirA1_454960 [Rhizophagus irregularis]